MHTVLISVWTSLEHTILAYHGAVLVRAITNNYYCLLSDWVDSSVCWPNSRSTSIEPEWNYFTHFLTWLRMAKKRLDNVILWDLHRTEWHNKKIIMTLHCCHHGNHCVLPYPWAGPQVFFFDSSFHPLSPNSTAQEKVQEKDQTQ